jgi:hypothetical protein
MKKLKEWKDSFLFFLLYSQRSILSEYYWLYLTIMIISLFVYKYTIFFFIIIIAVAIYIYYSDFTKDNADTDDYDSR